MRKKEEDVVRRREVHRERQQKYRDRKLLEMEKNINDIHELKQKVCKWNEYYDLLIQERLLMPVNRDVMQHTILEVYGSLILHGLQPDSTSNGRLQARFFEVLFMPSVIAQFIQQLERYSLLHPKMSIQVLTISTIRSNVLRVSQRLLLPLKHHSLLALYPHMMHNANFLELAMDKVLELHLELTFRFNDQNGVEDFCVEDDSPQAWFTLLGDLNMVAETLKERKMKSMVLREEEVKEAIKEEAKMMVKLTGKRPRVIKLEEKEVTIIDRAATSTDASTTAKQEDWEFLSQPWP